MTSKILAVLKLHLKPQLRHIVVMLALAVLVSSVALAQEYVPSQGRLTLNSSQPVMTSDVVNTSTIYYVDYVGPIVPLVTGSGGTLTYSSAKVTYPLTLTLTSSQVAGAIYDIFFFETIGGTFQIGVGPAWASSTSRGTGTGTTEISQNYYDEVWRNDESFIPTNGTLSFPTLTAGKGTYLGSVYMTADGETSMQFQPAAASGGSASVLGLYNAYNRVPVSSQSVDSTNSWTYAGDAWRASDNSTSNRVSFLDGLQQSPIAANFLQASNQTYQIQATIGCQIDATTGGPPGFLGSLLGQSGYLTMNAKANFDPQLGLHYIQAMEFSSGTTTTFYGAGNMLLQIALEM